MRRFRLQRYIPLWLLWRYWDWRVDPQADLIDLEEYKPTGTLVRGDLAEIRELLCDPCLFVGSLTIDDGCVLFSHHCSPKKCPHKYANFFAPLEAGIELLRKAGWTVECALVVAVITDRPKGEGIA